MNVQVEGRHLRVSSSTREQVLTKVEPLSRYFDGLHDIRVVLVKEDEQLKKVEIICGVIRGQQLVATASHANLAAALDEATRKARELLKKFKSRLRGRARDRRRNVPQIETVEAEEED